MTDTLRQAEAQAHARLQEAEATHDRACHDAVKALANAAAVELDQQRAELERLQRENERLQHHAEVVQTLNDYLSERDDVREGERVDFCVMRLLDEQREEIVRLLRIAEAARGVRDGASVESRRASMTELGRLLESGVETQS